MCKVLQIARSTFYYDTETATKKEQGLIEELGIQSKYAQASYKPMTSRPNEESVRNVLNREFQVDKEMSVLSVT